MKILGLKSKVRLDNYTVTVTGITTKGLTLLKDRGDSIEITFAEAEKFLQNKQMEVLEI